MTEEEFREKVEQAFENLRSIVFEKSGVELETTYDEYPPHETHLYKIGLSIGSWCAKSEGGCWGYPGRQIVSVFYADDSECWGVKFAGQNMFEYQPQGVSEIEVYK